MKSRGQGCWMTEERDDNVMQVYGTIIEQYGFSISKRELYRRVAESRARRFWVIPSSAKRTIYRMMYGRPIRNQSPERKRMYSEILARVRDYMQAHHNVSVSRAVAWVVAQPAPEFYLSTQTIKHIILNNVRNS